MANPVATFATAYGALFAASREPKFGAAGGTWAPGGLQLGIGETNPYKTPVDRLAWYRGWIYKAVSTVAADMASLNVIVERGYDDDAERVDAHPLRELLQHPTPWMRSNRFKQRITQHLLLAGEAFVYQHRANPNAPPTELHVLQPERTLILPDPARYIVGYLYYAWNGESLAFLADEVYHLKLENPYDPYRGMSPVQALGWTPEIEEGVRAYVRNYLRNNARPDLVLSTDIPNVPRETAEEVRQRWEEAHRSYSAAGRVAVLGSSFKPVPFTPPLKDLVIAELANWSRDEILAAYNVPAAKLGLVADSNRSNSEAADHTYRSNALNPLAELFNQDLYDPLSEQFSDDVHAYFEDPVPLDQEREFEQATTQFQAGAITQRQYLQATGSPYADEAADVYYVPPKTTIVSHVDELTQAGQTSEAQEVADDDAADEADEDEQRAMQSRIRALAAAEYRERKTGVYDARTARKRWAQALGDVRRADHLLREIERNVERYGLVEAFERLKGRGAKAIAKAVVS